MNRRVDPFDLPRTEACDRTEDELAETARALREGGELTTGYLAVAAHLAGCPRCRIVFAELMNEPGEISHLTDAPVDPTALFERALMAGLARPESVARARAADRLAIAPRPGAHALAALAMTATEDADPRVRVAALKALDELDTQVSIPKRLIEAWAAAPEEAVPFVAGVLERLAGRVPSILRLALRKTPGRWGFAVTGTGRVRGNIDEAGRDVWLRLRGLPSVFERLTPVVAVPSAPLEGAPPMRWEGEFPGLVPAEAPVTKGSVDVLLGAEPPLQSESLFRRMYLLGPDRSAEPL
jgi:hypothetical protein